MRNRSFATLGLLALLAAASAFGQHKMTTDIPFEFRVGASVMPAGHYDVTVVPNVLHLRCYECRTKLIFIQTSNLGGGPYPHTESRLVFNRYGDTYFLSEVWSPERGEGSGLPKSKAEREISRRTSLAQTSQIVLARR